jgi:cytochrome c oxidase subunit 2
MIALLSSLPNLLLLQTPEQDMLKWKVAEDGGGGFFMPPQASTVAEQIDSDYFMIQNWSLFFTVLIFFVMFYFAWKFHRSRHPKAVRTATHNTALELLWSVPPGFVLIYMFWRGFVGYLDLREPPQDAEQIQVSGMKWNWTFTYANGASSGELHIPVDRPTKLTMTSSDVIHSFFVPAFRTKMDVVPGRYTTTWFTPTRTGRFTALCTEYCGTKHSNMLSPVFVHTEEEYQAKLDELANWLRDFQGTPAEAGARVFRDRGCTACHSIDGSKLIGPSLKGVFGHQVKLADGRTVLADENYVVESIENPNAAVVEGYPAGQMPSFKGQISPEYMTALIAYIKSLGDESGAAGQSEAK